MAQQRWNAVLLLSAVVGGAHATPIADSFDDFIAAMNDGIGADGGTVTAGGTLDAAQQSHTDGSGSGSWSYGYGRSGDGQAFSGGFPLMDTWNGVGWSLSGSSSTFVSAGGQAPVGSSINASPMSYRRWTSNGTLAGQMLTANVSVTLLSPISDGVTLVLNSSGTIDDREILIAPETAGVAQEFSLDFFDNGSDWLLAGIRPDGTGPFNATNFFNDSVQIQVTIVPAPGTLIGASALGLAAASRRRSRQDQHGH